VTLRISHLFHSVFSIDEVDKFSKRLVRVTKQHNEDTKNLLRLMGVPSVDALSEAEAQCSVLVKDGKVYGTGTEDMDALTFGTTKVRSPRHLQLQNGSEYLPFISTYLLSFALVAPAPHDILW
jgi:5'-3' exonuclease